MFGAYFRIVGAGFPGLWNAWRKGAALAVLHVFLLSAALAFAAGPAFAAGDDALLDALKHGRSQERREALLSLAEQGAIRSVPPIAKLLYDDDLVVRKLAENALWGIWSRSGDEEVDEMMRRGGRLMMNGDPGRAVPFFDAVIQRLPDFAEGYNKRATAYYHIRQYEKSLRDIAETLRRNSYHFGALSGAGLCMIGLKRYREALAYFDRALKINPNLESILQLKKALSEKLNRQAT